MKNPGKYLFKSWDVLCKLANITPIENIRDTNENTISKLYLILIS